MSHFLRVVRVVLLAGLFTGPAALSGMAAPPNWKASGTGSTTPAGAVDVDEFSGRSTHVGPFTASGYHVLNPVDFTFAGVAVWTTPNGDTLNVSYSGQIFPGDDPDFPYAFVADIVAEGGTGRLAAARGQAVMTGAFSGIPGDFYFDIRGTFRARAK
jgi:hypothetical protein